MNRSILMGLVVLSLLVPSVASAMNPSDAIANAPTTTIRFTSEQAMKDWQAQVASSDQHALDVPATFTVAQATDVLTQLYEGKTVDSALIVETVKFMKGLKDTDAAAAGALAIQNLVLAKANEIQSTKSSALNLNTLSGNPNQNTFDQLGAIETAAQAAVPANPVTPAYLAPHGAQSIASYYALYFSYYVPYCGIWSCLVYYTYTGDALSAASFQHGGLTDTAVAQYPFSSTYYYGYSCWSNWFWWYCSTFSGYYTNDMILASGVHYTFAYPADSGTFATRAEASDVLQSAYDRIGNLYSQTPREWTSASNTPTIPSNAAGVTNQVPIPGPVMTPPAGPFPSFNVGGGALDTQSGLGDIGTAAPAVNFYGVQKSTTVPDCTPSPAPTQCAVPLPAWPGPTPPTVPAPPPVGPVTPTDPALYYNGIHLREHGDYGAAPADSTGVTAVDNAAVLRTFHPNVLFVRWHDAGAGTTGKPEAEAKQVPAEFVYSTDSYFLGGNTHVDAYYNMVDPL